MSEPMTNLDDTTWNAIAALAERDARIAQLEAEIERLTEREAQAKLDGVRAMKPYATKADSDGDDGA